MNIYKELTEQLSNLPDYSSKPAVALETTIVSHGMPYPANVETAIALEHEITAQGAIPVTIGIVKGQIKIGMTPDEIDFFAKHHEEIVKVSRNNLGYVLANKLSGATTVAATMLIANLANIKVFATGGIGGVHREGNETFDISADLLEFSKSEVNVVCAGPKAILDLPLTLEYLETNGVPLIGYKTDYLPMFYSAKSNYRLEQRADSVEDLANIINSYRALNLKQGCLVVNPIPDEDSLDPTQIEIVIEKALELAKANNIKGKAVTPYLLDYLNHHTGGKALSANISLVKNNARLAGKLAVSLLSE
ncbi:MAG: pseudouridine-5'-phosphate glycosidase [Firmicutes bacterium]|uniref:Pseudouridine-5'-phosphate glycosidase n=1 Tax=Candidatus Scatoplasma merdavium TaxID=2840932 RepID=A0A9D9D757_9BACL|nr:pseudouridine-5'-phosphate glycosidase [Candidatus Scatoplasma merdavium]